MRNVIASLRAMLTQNTDEIKAAHERINLLNQRVSQVEHYAGMRKHNFQLRDQRWNFNQLQSDVKQGRIPRERASTLRAA